MGFNESRYHCFGAERRSFDEVHYSTLLGGSLAGSCPVQTEVKMDRGAKWLVSFLNDEVARPLDSHSAGDPLCGQIRSKAESVRIVVCDPPF